MTECTQSEFPFAAHHGRPVIADFSGPATTSDGGALLLRFGASENLTTPANEKLTTRQARR